MESAETIAMLEEFVGCINAHDSKALFRFVLKDHIFYLARGFASATHAASKKSWCIQLYGGLCEKREDCRVAGLRRQQASL